MKKVFLLFMTVAAITSCSKDDSSTDSNQDSCQIVKLSGNYTDIAFTYGSNGKVSQIVDASDGANHKKVSEISYSDSKITVKNTFYNGAYSESESVNYTLDNSGKITSSSDGSIYTYNSTGYLSEAKSGQLSETFTYANDNLIKIKTTYGTYSYNTNIDYDSQESHVQYVLDSESISKFETKALYEQGYFGKKSKNRITSSTEDGDTSNFTYEKNSNGKVNKVTTKSKESSSSTYLEYNCK